MTTPDENLPRTWYHVEITNTAHPDDPVKCAGPAGVTASWLRAYADHIDPPRKIMRTRVDLSNSDTDLLEQMRKKIRKDGAP